MATRSVQTKKGSCDDNDDTQGGTKSRSVSVTPSTVELEFGVTTGTNSDFDFSSASASGSESPASATAAERSRDHSRIEDSLLEHERSLLQPDFLKDGYYTAAEWEALREVVFEERRMHAENRSQQLCQRIHRSDVVIGRGTYGVVLEGIDGDTGEIVAVKEVETQQLRDKAVHALEREMMTLRELSHPHIVRYRGMEYNDQQLSLFMEFCPGGSLSNVLATFGALSFANARSYTFQIVCGLDYLHRHSVMHRDLKCANCLLSSNGIVKLGDFGAAHQLGVSTTDSIAGTARYIAPEVLAGSQMGRKADIWSLGCCVLEMFALSIPFADQFSTELSVLRQLATMEQSPAPPDNMPKVARDFLQACYQLDPAERPTARQLRKFEFIAGMEESAAYANSLEKESGRDREHRRDRSELGDKFRRRRDNPEERQKKSHKKSKSQKKETSTKTKSGHVSKRVRSSTSPGTLLAWALPGVPPLQQEEDYREFFAAHSQITTKDRRAAQRWLKSRRAAKNYDLVEWGSNYSWWHFEHRFSEGLESKYQMFWWNSWHSRVNYSLWPMILLGLLGFSKAFFAPSSEIATRSFSVSDTNAMFWGLLGIFAISISSENSKGLLSPLRYILYAGYFWMVFGVVGEGHGCVDFVIRLAILVFSGMALQHPFESLGSILTYVTLQCAARALSSTTLLDQRQSEGAAQSSPYFHSAAQDTLIFCFSGLAALEYVSRFHEHEREKFALYAAKRGPELESVTEGKAKKIEKDRSGKSSKSRRRRKHDEKEEEQRRPQELLPEESTVDPHNLSQPLTPSAPQPPVRSASQPLDS